VITESPSHIPLIRIRLLRVLVAAVCTTAMLLVLPTAGAVPTATTSEISATGWVTQVGTYDYLTQPDYDGLIPLSRVAGTATIGLGTFDRLDGELVMLRGVVYRVGTDGIPRTARLTRTTPFYEGVRFTPQASMRLPEGTQCSSLVPIINELARTADGMVAVRLIGTFEVLTARSVPAQTKPYPPLSDVVADQTVFPLTSVRATLVGFRTGADLMGIGAPGLHLHGLTSDRSAGGHILGCTASGDVRISLQVTRGVRVLSAATR
jgi:acetolactate decarboxylase